MPRCKKCYKKVDTLIPIYVEGKALKGEVCRGCYYEIDRSMGFLVDQGAYFGIGYSTQMQYDEAMEKEKKGVVKGEEKPK